MDSEYWRRVERVLDVALESDPSRWSAVVSDACEGDETMRAAVEDILSRYGDARSFLETPPASLAAALLAEEADAAETGYEGREFGAYRAVREIGRGGQSRVLLAERADGEFDQQVAIKILRPTFDADLARFRAERQILATLNHPNIGRLLDGGVAADGLPYLVLELVDGVPIDQYCDAAAYDVRARVELFLVVASAVQAAHRNLVVHRDLKPSNILVTPDGVVKLLDFGLAKLLDPLPRLADAPSTMTGQRWMTPEYAAPEQVLSQPITTSTDVYQLGAVLYRLLVGRPPFGDRGANVHRLETAILEHDVEPLGDSLGGDLDAIVRKALAKEPDARYASVQDFSNDLRRYLTGEPVLARRQTAGYRTRRFVRRHRAAVCAAAALGTLLAVYVGTVIVDRARIRAALTEAQAGTRKAEQVTDFMLGLFRASDQGQSLHDTVTAHLLLSRGVDEARALTGQPELQAQMLDVIGRIHTQLGEADQARPLLTQALNIRRSLYGETHPDVATSLEGLADASEAERNDQEAVRLRRRVLELRRRWSGNDDPKTVNALFELATALHRAGDLRNAQPLFAEWTTAIERQPREATETRGNQLNEAGVMAQSRGDYDDAVVLLRQSLAIRESLYGEHHSLVAISLRDVANVLSDAGRMTEAEPLLSRAESILRSLSPDGHPQLWFTLKLHVVNLQRLNRFADAEALAREAIALGRRFEGANSVTVANLDIDLGYTLCMIGEYKEAETFDRDAIRIYRSMFNDKNAMVVMARDHLGDALRGEGRFAEAESLLLAGYERFKVPNSITKRWRGHALIALVRLYDAEGRAEEAAKYRALLAAAPPGREAGGRSGR